MTPGMVGYSADNVRQHIGFISNKLTNQFQDGEHVIGVVLSGYFKSIGLYKTFNHQQLIEAQKLLKLVGMAEFENESSRLFINWTTTKGYDCTCAYK